MNMKTATFIVVGQLLLCPAGLRAEVIVNGGFEIPVVTGSYSTFTAPSDGITGWQVESGSVDLVRTTLYPSYEGIQSLDLNGLGPGTISQNFATAPGGFYELTFMYANNALVASGSADVAVVGSELLLSDTITHSGSTLSDMNYVAFRRSFRADSESTILRFVSTTDGRGGIAIDAVSVVAVPEPSAITFWLLGGLVSLFVVGSRSVRRHPGE